MEIMRINRFASGVRAREGNSRLVEDSMPENSSPRRVYLWKISRYPCIYQRVSGPTSICPNAKVRADRLYDSPRRGKEPDEYWVGTCAGADNTIPEKRSSRVESPRGFRSLVRGLLNARPFRRFRRYLVDYDLC